MTTPIMQANTARMRSRLIVVHEFAASPMWGLLSDELAEPSTPLPWQIALGAVVDAMPPMGPEPFAPQSVRGRVADAVPEFMRQLWSRPCARDKQVELAWRSRGFLEPTCLPVVQSLAQGRWWTRPECGESLRGEPPTHYEPCLVTTTGPWLSAPCVAAFGQEDSYGEPWPCGEEDMMWRPIVPVFEPRVYEIDNAAAWIHLVEAHPARFVSTAGAQQRTHGLELWFADHRLYEPDWPAVAQEWDAVHLTQLAYAECAYAVIPCLDGVTTITGWGPDATVWLRHPLG